MRLNIHCVRDILLVIEEQSRPDIYVRFVNDAFSASAYGYDAVSVPAYQVGLIDKYGCEQVLYHVSYCEKAGLVSINHSICGMYEFIVDDLTPQGHEFLTNIRNDKVWKRVIKFIAENGFPATLASVVEIASSFVKKLISDAIF